MRVLVCGGRDYTDAQAVADTLGVIHRDYRIAELATGGAKGADTLAREWALSQKIPCLEYLANWTAHGRAAGPIRNQAMLNEFKPDLVVEFPGGRGTADMTARARLACVPISIPTNIGRV